MNLEALLNPVDFKHAMWPDVEFYDRQWECIRSVERNKETFVVAGNMLGKDFLTGFIVVWAFVTHPVARIVTTSVKDDHLVVLWGEIGRFLDTARWPLKFSSGGPLIVNHRELKKKVGSEVCKISYVKGMVSAKGEGMAGHHAPYTLGVMDEASGIDDLVYTQMGTWAKRILAIGNPNPGEGFFKKSVKGGDILVE